MAEIFPIAGGKGGAGKSFISANLGALIARRGRRVALVDLDLGGSNLHTFLGIRNPREGIEGFLSKQVADLGCVAVPTQMSNLAFIGSVHCSIEIANILYAQKIKLIHALKKLPFDYILLDMGAGTHFNTLDFYLTSDIGIVVLTPEPTSIENAFRFIKAAYLRRLKQVIRQYDFHPQVKETVLDAGHPQAGIDAVFDAVERHDPGREIFLRESVNRCQFKFILNQFRDRMDPQMGQKISAVCSRHFYTQFHFLGNVAYDERVWSTIVNKTLFALQYPDATASLDMQAIVDQLIRKDPSARTRCHELF